MDNWSSVVNKFPPWSMLITASVDFVYISRRVRRTEQNGCFVCIGKSEAEVTNNKCIGDDTKAAARQSPNYIKKTKKN